MIKSKKRSIAAISGALVLAGGLFSLPATAADLLVEVNQSRLHQLSSAASTIIVGNPAIADVSLSNASTLVVFGRTFGQTNLIALDENGRQIANLDLNVVASRDTSALTVNRGISQTSYNCTPDCVRVLNPTDDAEATNALLAATSGVNDLNNSAAGAGGGE